MAKQLSLVIGDHVRLKSRKANEHSSSRDTNVQVVPMLEPIDGLVLSIRDVHTGQLVPKTTAELDQYVVELLFDNTFNAKYASLRNAPRGAERPETTPSWRRVRAMLRDAADKGQFLSSATPNHFRDSQIAKALDGWKIVKVLSREIESLELVSDSAELTDGAA